MNTERTPKMISVGHDAKGTTGHCTAQKVSRVEISERREYSIVSHTLKGGERANNLRWVERKKVVNFRHVLITY